MRESRLWRFKGADPGPAIAEQKAARLQSAAQFKQQMALEQEQLAQAQSIKPPIYAPAAPLTAGGQDAYNAGLEAKRKSVRRFGSAATNLQAPMGIAPLGGATPAY